MADSKREKNYRQLYAIKKANERRLLKLNPNLTSNSGIYFFTRTDENDISYFYIGQSVNCLQRLCSHLLGREQHIDLSILKRGLFSDKNPYGWKVNMIEYPKEDLDKWEKYWILEYTKKGYQCRYNKTAGGQGKGKEQINERVPNKGYRDGIEQGKKNISKEISGYFEKYLDAVIKKDCFTKKNKPSKNAENALQKFNDFLEYYKKDKDSE